MSERIVRYWTSPADLAGQVARSLIRIRQSHPAEGWVRASNALTPEVEQEVADLRLKVRELEASLRERQTTLTGAPVETLNETLCPISAVLRFWSKEDVEKGRDKEWRAKPRWVRRQLAPTVSEVLAEVGPRLLVEDDVTGIQEALIGVCVDELGEIGPEGKYPSTYARGVDLEVDDDSTREVILRLHSMGLIEQSSRRHPISDTSQYWSLTEAGKGQLIVVRNLGPAEGGPNSEKPGGASVPTAPRGLAKKAPAKKAPAKKAPAKKAPAKKAPAKKAPAKKAPAKKAPAKKAPAKR